MQCLDSAIKASNWRGIIVIDKAGDYPAAEVSYVLDARSGEYREAAEESRPGKAPRPIVRDGIAKVYMS